MNTFGGRAKKETCLGKELRGIINENNYGLGPMPTMTMNLRITGEEGNKTMKKAAEAARSENWWWGNNDDMDWSRTTYKSAWAWVTFRYKNRRK